MVKKVSLSPKKDVSKNHHQEKKQLSCMINVLRPKVYITDTSNFKKLVQELTGNTTTTTKTTAARTSTISSSSSSPPDIHQSHKINKLVLPVIDLVDQDQDDLQLFLADQEIMSQLDNNCYMDDQTRMYDASFEHLSAVNSKEEGLLAAYQDLESWLLQDSDGQETQDPCHVYNYDYNYSYNYGQFGDQQEQISIYDYQLSELIWEFV